MHLSGTWSWIDAGELRSSVKNDSSTMSTHHRVRHRIGRLQQAAEKCPNGGAEDFKQKSNRAGDGISFWRVRTVSGRAASPAERCAGCADAQGAGYAALP